MSNATKTVTCPKCDGHKHIAGFSHIADGVCFQCSGAGVINASSVGAKSSPFDIERYNAKEAFLFEATDRQIANLSPAQHRHIAGFCDSFGFHEIYAERFEPIFSAWLAGA